MAEETKNFEWIGIDKLGNRKKGVIHAIDEKSAHVQVEKMGIEVVNIKPVRALNFSIFQAMPKKNKIKPMHVLFFTRYVSVMLAAGLPIMQALDIIAHDQENLEMRTLITTIRNNISSGKTLAEAFSQHPNIFSDLYCNLIKAGEKSGTIDKILQRLGDYLERTETLKKKIKKALIYPVAILCIAFIVSLLLLIFVVPQFQAMFKSFGATLPLFTRVVVYLSDFVRSYWWIIVGAITGISIGAKYLLKQNKDLQEQRDKLVLKMPLIGNILTKGIIARYTRTLATTIESGMPLVEAMKSLVPIMGNSLYRQAVTQVLEEVTSGHQLSVAMANTKLFPNMALQMISIGEASGSLGAMLNKVASYYEDEVNQTVDNLSSLLEPLIMLILGIIIGGFVVAMYLPIFKLGSLF